jgi:hypothetical protein
MYVSVENLFFYKINTCKPSSAKSPSLTYFLSKFYLTIKAKIVMHFFACINPVARISSFIMIIFYWNVTNGQNVEVRMNTGTAHISIPVYEIKVGELSADVSLEYSARGVRPADLEGVLGTGWQLNAGGCITRELRDLPDDIKADQSGNNRVGWLFNSNATKIGSFSIANDNNTSTCTDETTDLSYISSQLSDNSDLEPDIFDVNAPGLSCQIVYDQANGAFRAIPYQDLQISYTLNATLNSITSFTITNDKGIIYTFAVPEAVGHTTSSTNPPGVIYFNRYYSLWQHGIIFNQKWYLSKIADPNGNFIALTYTNAYGTMNLSIPTAVVTGLTGNNSVRTVLYTDAISYKPNYVTNIQSYNKLTNEPIDQAFMSYVATTNAQLIVLQSINLLGGRQFNCSYGKVPTTTRDFLSSFGENGCYGNSGTYNSKMYYFNYYGVNFSSSNPNGNLWDLPLDGSGQDYWGFPNPGVDPFAPRIFVYPDNPSYPNLERYRFTAIAGYTGTSYTLNGEYKTVDPVNITTGTLNSIMYPTGGTTTFIYEPNDYYDVSAAAFSSSVTSQGGGLRIKQIVDYDGLNTANNIIRNYTYLDPVTGVTSGKPVALPALSFTLPYTGTATGLDYWNLSTVRLSTSSSNQNESVVYGTVTMQQTGKGKTVYQYTTPATFWDASAGTDWTPTMVNTGRSISGGSCPAVGSVKNSKYIYPFLPNANYDFERGLPTTVTDYSDAGNIISSKVYTYQRSFSAVIPITAFKFDINSSVTGYGKYQIFTSTSELISQETKYLNDIGNTTNLSNERITSSTAYSYGGTNHKLPTIIQITNTDGSVDKTYIKYVKDYTWSPTDYVPLRYLKDLNKNIPVERYYTVTRSGVEKTFGAELTKFGAFASGISSPSSMYLPSQSLKFISSTGVTDFAFSYNNAGVLWNYPGYLLATNYTAYNNTGNLLSQNDGHNNVKTNLILNTMSPVVASIINANYNEVAYSNYDGSDTLYGFGGSGCTINTSINRTGVNSLTFPSTGLIQTTRSLAFNAKNYVFSIWVNTATSGTLTISLYNTVGTLISTKTISYSPSGSSWNYYEQKVPTSGVTTGGFNLQVHTSSSINIDDVLFYPENAEVTTYAYNPNNFLKTAETNTNGVSKYFGYDQFYRLQYVFDQDKNIVLKNTYASASTASTGVISASFSTTPASNISVGTSVNFSGLASSGSCTPGTLYSYDFGDGSSTTPSLTGSTATHSFTTAGTYTVNFTISNPLFGTKTFPQSVTILMLPVYCQYGVYAYYGGHIYTQNCGTHTGGTTSTTFLVSSVTGLPAGHTLTYQWQIAYLSTGANCGSTSWTNVSGGTSSSYTKSFSPSTFCQYEVRCTVTDTNNGQVVTTGVMSVLNNNE